MKYSVEQMMFAATVRDLAVKRRHYEAERLSGSEYDLWISKHPIDSYVTEVVNEFEEIGDTIFGVKTD